MNKEILNLADLIKKYPEYSSFEKITTRFVLDEEKYLEYKNHPFFKHLNLTFDEVKRNISFFNQIIEQEYNCSKLGSKCNDLTNYHLTVSRLADRLYFAYVPCMKMEKIKNDNKYKLMYLYNYYSTSEISNIFLTDMKGQKVDKSKNIIINCFRELTVNKSQKGIYIYGKCGVGKTYLSFGISNWYAKKEYSIAFVYLPDFTNLIKSGFNSISDKEKANEIYKHALEADVLMLDDIGSEYASDWFYSNYLLNILNLRSNENKITYFNSNYSLDELKKVFINRCKNIDKSKICERIIDRIKMLVNNNIFELRGKNMRTGE